MRQLKASDILRAAETDIKRKAELRDVGAERSMLRTVKSFNVITGHGLTEFDGWLFMVCLKLARGTAGALVVDDWQDAAAYCALALEAAMPDVEVDTNAHDLGNQETKDRQDG